MIVGNVLCRSGIEINILFDAAHAPIVLTFQVGAGTPAVDFHGHDVLSIMQIPGDIPL